MKSWVLLLGISLLSLGVALRAAADENRFRATTFAMPGTYSSIVAIEGDHESSFLGERSNKTLDLIQCEQLVCQIKASTKVNGHVWASSATPDGIVLAIGYGFGTGAIPLRLYRFDRGLRNASLVFEVATERAQVSRLRFEKNALWMTYFSSRFEVKSGYFEPKSEYPWRFLEVRSGRLEDAVDNLADIMIVGRPYGGGEGEDGDLKLIRKGSEPQLLPSYRGVRAVEIIRDSSKTFPSVIVADGWHQNYGKLAQARLSLLQWSAELNRYGSYLVDRDVDQYSYSKLIVINTAEKSLCFLGIGDKRINLFSASDGLRAREILETSSRDVILDAALLGGREGNYVVTFSGAVTVSELKC